MHSKVSILLPVFNSEKTIERAVNSILAQTLENFELIIIDDASTDQTSQILSTYNQLDRRVIIKKNEQNLGLARTLNKAISMSRGIYIARMDADDWAFPERLEKQVAFLDVHPEVDILGTGVFRVSQQGELLKKDLRPTTHERLIKTIYKTTPFYHPSVMIRRRVFSEIGIYDPTWQRCEDVDLWQRTYKFCRFHNLDEALLKYTVSDRPQRLSECVESTRMVLKNGVTNKCFGRAFAAAVMGVPRFCFHFFKFYILKYFNRQKY
jgi:glycosyltransferase involved in cell wall biosynthesis